MQKWTWKFDIRSEVNSSLYLRGRLEDWDNFNKVITRYEKWLFEYNDSETKRQSMEWKRSEEKCFKKACMSKSKTKNLVITFFDICGIVLKHWVPGGPIVNSMYYVVLLEKLWLVMCHSFMNYFTLINEVLHILKMKYFIQELLGPCTSSSSSISSNSLLQ